jgi:SAM-dependent methyltransferase
VTPVSASKPISLNEGTMPIADVKTAANPRADARYQKHRASFLRTINPYGLKGLEVGAFDLPMVDPSEALVKFADYSTTQELKVRAAAHPQHSADFVVNVDYILRDVGWTEIPADFDWICASHVIEHVPNIVGWLQTLATKLKRNGVLFLVIPDKRYTFDIHRPKTSLGKILVDYYFDRRIARVEDVFDAMYYADIIDPIRAWSAPVRPGERNTPVDIHDVLQRTFASIHTYIDVHCNVFTVESWREILDAIVSLQLIPFVVGEIGDVERNNIDFHCVLRKARAAVDTPSLPVEFDRDVYLAIHTDVAAAGIDPEQHYLAYGYKEGRRLK